MYKNNGFEIVMEVFYFREGCFLSEILSKSNKNITPAKNYLELRAKHVNRKVKKCHLGENNKIFLHAGSE